MVWSLESLRISFAETEQRLPAVLHERGMVSQARAAEISGVSRAEFIEALARFGVTPFQADAEELIAEVANE